jgi:hypothetical protein
MLKELLMSSAIVGVLAFGVSTSTMIAQQTTATEDAKKAGKETKRAGKEAGYAKTTACNGHGGVAAK